MSIKIYHGYRIKGTLSRAVRIVNAFRPKATSLAEQSAAKRLATDAVVRFDRQHFWGADDAPLYHAWKRMLDRQREVARTHERDPEIDFSCSASLLVQRRQVLVMFFAEQSALVSLWEAQDGIEPYGYWDNTDQEESISGKAWKKRRHDWSSALNQFRKSPAMAGGLTVTLSPDMVVPDGFDAIEPYLPSFEERVSYWSMEMVLQQVLKERFGEGQAARKDVKPSEYMQAFFAARDDKERQVEMSTHVRHLLKPSITREDLLPPRRNQSVAAASC